MTRFQAMLYKSGEGEPATSARVTVGLVVLAVAVYALLLFAGPSAPRSNITLSVSAHQTKTDPTLPGTSWTIRLRTDETVPASASSTLKDIARKLRGRTAAVVSVARDTADEVELRTSEDRALAVISELNALAPDGQELSLQGEVRPEPAATDTELREVTVILLARSQ